MNLSHNTDSDVRRVGGVPHPSIPPVPTSLLYYSFIFLCTTDYKSKVILSHNFVFNCNLIGCTSGLVIERGWSVAICKCYL